MAKTLEPHIVVGTRLLVSKQLDLNNYECVAYSWGEVITRSARTLTVKIEKDNVTLKFNAHNGGCENTAYQISLATFSGTEEELKSYRLSKLRRLVSTAVANTEDDASLQAALLVLPNRRL
jgi:hypothetical protein